MISCPVEGTSEMRARVALSVDLRSRIVEAVDNGDGTHREVAERFCVDLSSVNRFLKRYRETGSVAPSANRGRPPRIVDEEGRERIAKLVASVPDATLTEYTEMYNLDAVRPISRATMGRKIRQLKLTRKKRP